MLPGVAEFVILGVTVDGQVFQQPAWAQQLCGSLGTTAADGRPLSSAYMRPVTAEGVDAVVVRVALQVVDEQAFEAVKRFIAENRLQVRAGRGSRDAEVTGKHPALKVERRLPENNKGW